VNGYPTVLTSCGIFSIFWCCVTVDEDQSINQRVTYNTNRRGRLSELVVAVVIGCCHVVESLAGEEGSHCLNK